MRGSSRALPVVRSDTASGDSSEEDIDGIVGKLAIVDEVGAALVIEADPGNLDPDAPDDAPHFLGAR